MTVGRLILRAVVGGLFVGHGTQKLFGWFGGGGPEGTGAMMESAGLRPGRRNALATGTAETLGGALLAVGLATPVAASALSGVMLGAIRTVHWKNGVWNQNGGYEFPAVMLAAVFALTDAGPGPISLDRAIGQERHGLLWACAQFGAAAVATDRLIRAARRRPATTTEAADVTQRTEEAPLRRAA